MQACLRILLFATHRIEAHKISYSYFLKEVDWLQSLKQFFIKVSYHILVASLTLMALLQLCKFPCCCNSNLINSESVHAATQILSILQISMLQLKSYPWFNFPCCNSFSLTDQAFLVSMLQLIDVLPGLQVSILKTVVLLICKFSC